MKPGIDVLVVEDSPADAELILMALGDAGLADRAFVVHDGVEALNFLFHRNEYATRVGSEAPLFVLLDIMMPRLGGFDVLREVKSNAGTRCIPIVMFTSSIVDRDVLRAYELGANSYIQKPVDYDQLRAVLSTLVHYWTGANERVPRALASSTGTQS